MINFKNREELLIGLTLILHKNRNTLSVTEVEILQNALHALKEERTDVFNDYILPLLRLIIVIISVFF